ncbi:hypothetical protein PAHAL_9G592000 [Panicum hallii]|uniref:F-box domain-containing protein n=1 Tax=Panicum hallii TaxID=206008 RepID=A0A2S3ITZ1_9POAL|nr:hypothetical protein PAHAL_9G592000 [Panicum hallii]
MARKAAALNCSGDSRTEAQRSLVPGRRRQARADVAWRVLGADVVDYIAFRGACSGWRACTPSPRDPTLRNYWFRPRRWVALFGGDAVRPDDAGEITFLHTRTARCLRVSLPELGATGSPTSPTASSSSCTSATPPSACSTPSRAPRSTSRPSPPCSKSVYFSAPPPDHVIWHSTTNRSSDQQCSARSTT